MGLSTRLHLRQTQSLVITPQLMQAIRLLQMSGLELGDFVASEVEQNPLLEQEECSADGGEEVFGGSSEDPVATDTEIERTAQLDAESVDLFPEGSVFAATQASMPGS